MKTFLIVLAAVLLLLWTIGKLRYLRHRQRATKMLATVGITPSRFTEVSDAIARAEAGNETKAELDEIAEVSADNAWIVWFHYLEEWQREIVEAAAERGKVIRQDQWRASK